MKILLFALNGSYSHTCLAVYCLRGALEKAGFAPKILESNLRDRRDDILQALYAERAQVYSFSCYIWNIEEMLSLAADLKALLPHAKMIFGGPEASYGVARFENADYIDHVVCGEGESVLGSLCQALSRGEKAERVLVAPAYAQMPEESILYRDGDDFALKMLYYESSRGCPYRCAYCLSSAQRGIRLKSVEKTLEDLRAFEQLSSEVQIIKFVDRTFNCDRERANRIWRALADPIYTKKYHFEICASLLNEESFAALSALPKDKIQLEIGLQSTNPDTLSAVARHIDSAQVIEATKRIYSMGNIHVHLDLIAGLPYESYGRFAQSFNDAYGCCDMLQLGFLKLLHGTELRDKALEYGIVFSQKPPYTVLETAWITREELYRLSLIADLLDRYASSGKFALCLPYAVSLADRPFAFYEGLLAHLLAVDGRHIRKLSQVDAFRILHGYCGKYMTDAQLREFETRMHEDFSTHEARRLPASVFRSIT